MMVQIHMLSHVDFDHKEERLREMTRDIHNRSEMQQEGGKEMAACLIRSLSKPSPLPGCTTICHLH
jgi:hypothetical protein